MRAALVIIDVQQGMFSLPDMPPHDGVETVRRIRSLLDKARAAQAPIFFVQHDGGADHPLAGDGPGFRFHADLTPLPGESVTVKTRCNAFHGTTLEAQLMNRCFETLIVCGMQSQYCVDTFVRAAAERGFALTLVGDCHTTFDTPSLSAAQIIAHHNQTLSGSFAAVMPASEIDFA
ncbi:MAG: cysteine hydrolase family protein [Sphingomonadaceae bacterium]